MLEKKKIKKEVNKSQARFYYNTYMSSQEYKEKATDKLVK